MAARSQADQALVKARRANGLFGTCEQSSTPTLATEICRQGGFTEHGVTLAGNIPAEHLSTLLDPP